MNANLTSFFVPRWLPPRAKGVKYYISLEADAPRLSAEEFWEFSRQNPDMIAELTKDGELTLMAPTGFETGGMNMQILIQLGNWALADRSGVATESNTGFILPNGATYAPDAAWTRNDRLDRFTAEQKRKFLPLCPDFVIELLSFSDLLGELQAKMDEYIENGLRLGWLVDPYRKRIHIYRADRDPEILDNPMRVSGENVLPGFELNLSEIW